MWGGAQRETTRRCASDWGQNLGEGWVKIPLIATSRVPKSVTLAYTGRTVLTVGGVNLRAYNFFISGPERRREGRKNHSKT